MAKMSKEYWEKRQHEREAKAYSSILEVEKEYKEALERAKLNINKQISHIGTTYMKDNQLSYAEATKQLKGTEYKVWRKQLDEYMQEWKQLKRTAPVEAKKLWLEIETLSARSRISRLDTIRTQIDIELSKVSSEAVESTRKALYGVYGDTYQEVMKDLGIKSMFSDSMAKAVIDRPWSGANYSSRLWGNSEKLARVLKQEVTTGMIQGINLKTMRKRISDRIEGAKKNDVERLLRTEVNYTMNQATLDGYKDAKIEKYTFDATLDSRTSQICAGLNGETFELSKAVVGVNYPPMHPRCRSTTTPVIDFEALGKQLQRKEKDLQEFEKESMINETRSYSDAVKKVLEYGHKTGNEGLIWLDLQGNEIIPFKTGSNNRVAITKETITYLKSLPTDTVISLHNHPGSSSFSTADMNVACYLPSVREMRVIGHDGTKYFLKIGNGQRPEKHILDDVYYRARNKLERKYIQELSDLSKRQKAWKELTHEINEKMAKKFGWEYRREL